MVIYERYTQVMLEQLFAQNELILDVLAPAVNDTAWLKKETHNINARLGFTDAIVKAIV